ncbi:PepSY domain-containing protein [Methyloligella sp. 2.7D]|uniref:PepSY domain-containing protein n=1 Tax=unclassified Methyloligella TaxID=2625955 RepID=UPI00157D1770|nr:PepSY domain-containing protein [Methyloligella sp. GL2]QKP78404.1 PepSY domain-containing protein [Methyloligella sp. GL2]
MKTLFTTTALAAMLAVSAAALPAFAWDGPRLNVPKERWMSPAELKDKLSAQGYKVYEIESDDGAYEVEMADKDGTRIETYVHPETGKLLPGYDD